MVKTMQNKETKEKNLYSDLQRRMLGKDVKQRMEIEIDISLDMMLELLTSQWFTTEVDGVRVSIRNPEIWRISEEEDLKTMVKWRKLIKELSKLKTKEDGK